MKKLAILFLATLIFSCEQVFMEPTPATDPVSVFNQVWDYANERYSFFEFKKIDWDATKLKYKDRVTANSTEEELFKVCYDMLYELKDEHTNLITRFDVSRNPEVILGYPTNFFPDVLERNYLNNARQQYIDGSFSLFEMNDVLYVRYTSFGNQVSDYAMDYLVKKMASKKGLILDMRDNGGGAINNIDTFLERMVDSDYYVGTDFYKNGPARNDFRKDSIFIKKVRGEGQESFSKPVVMLTNRGCYSATNRFAMVAKELPNFTLVGGKTGGGGGIPSTTQLSNGWIMRVSASQMFDPRGFNIEDGVFPDFEVNISPQDVLAGKDPILEKGLAIIRAN